MIKCGRLFRSKICIFLLVAIFLIVAVVLCWFLYTLYAKTDVIFQLATKENPHTYYPLSANRTVIENSPFNPKRPTRIFIHGFLSTINLINRYRDAYLKIGDYNFIGVDWTKRSSTFNYWAARGRAKKTVAADLTELLDALMKYGMDLKDVTIVGHSLGAHIAGIAAQPFRNKVAVIFGLDPASPLFDEKSHRLRSDDADYVQVIHTSGGNLGYATPLGQADIYPNNGRRQPGCQHNFWNQLIDRCSHRYVHDIFLESLSTTFTAIKCSSYQEMKQKLCSLKNQTATMGGDLTKYSPKPYGIYYLQTKDKPPYVITNYRTYEILDEID